MLKSRVFARGPFSFLFARSGAEDRIAAYVIREHRKGRPLAEVLDDPLVRTKLTEAQRNRLLERPDVVHAIGADLIAAHLRRGQA